MSDQVLFDEDLAALDAFLRDGNATAAFLRLETFEARLTSYIRDEELVLFPVLERFIAVPVMTIAKMRSEHSRVQRLLDTVWEALARQDRELGLETLCALRGALLVHCENEDRVLAPLLRVSAAVD